MNEPNTSPDTALLAASPPDAALCVARENQASFLTAIWASSGIALMGWGFSVGTGIQTYLQGNWHIAAAFVAGVYAVSYSAGKYLVHDSVRPSVARSIGVAFLIAEAALGFGSLLGGLSSVAHDVLQGGTVLLTGPALWTDVSAILMLCVFGVMFTLPLALGLGVHSWWSFGLREHRKARSLGEVLALPADACNGSI